MYNLHIFKFSKNKSGHLFQKLCFPPAHQNLRKILVPYFSKFYQKRNYLYEKKRNYSDRFLREIFCVWFFTGTIHQNVLLGFIILPIGHIYMHYSLYTMVVVSNYVENSCVMNECTCCYFILPTCNNWSMYLAIDLQINQIEGEEK